MRVDIKERATITIPLLEHAKLLRERDDLRQKLDASEKESANRWSIIKDDCHTEEQVKQIAIKHLTKKQVEGDSCGVPNSADLCEMLSDKIGAVKTELEAWHEQFGSQLTHATTEFDSMFGQLAAMTQERDSALAALRACKVYFDSARGETIDAPLKRQAVKLMFETLRGAE
jgi:hypothetical protein